MRVFGSILTVLDRSFDLDFRQIQEKDGILVFIAKLQYTVSGQRGVRYFTRHFYPHETENEHLNLQILEPYINYLAPILPITAIICILSTWERAERSHEVINALSNLLAIVLVTSAASDLNGPNPTPLQCLQQRVQLQLNMTSQYLWSLYRCFASILNPLLFFAK